MIARGGNSSVYAAWDPKHDREVALKFLSPEDIGQGLSNVPRFKREARALANLDHPNVITLLGGGEALGGAYIVMELLRGKTLREWLAARPVSTRALEVMRQAGVGLAAAHDAGMVHRDFKPDNVMIEPDGRVCVLDFGLAKGGAASAKGNEPIVDGWSSVNRTPLSRLTEPGSVLGTIEYMAPEQHLAGLVDARSDQFSYCVTTYEAVFGARPFEGHDVGTILRAMGQGVSSRPPRPAAIDARGYRALARGLSIDPAARWPSVTALLGELFPG
ncbi:MAG: serine/threonine-protein kinase [Nannocystaceae bacterium]|nr:serine/threonine protein kinase [bacterium]